MNDLSRLAMWLDAHTAPWVTEFVGGIGFVLIAWMVCVFDLTHVALWQVAILSTVFSLTYEEWIDENGWSRKDCLQRVPGQLFALLILWEVTSWASKR